MSKADLCPVCKGSGQVSPPNDGSCTVMPQMLTCYGCSGKGWVEVSKAGEFGRNEEYTWYYGDVHPLGQQGNFS